MSIGIKNVFRVAATQSVAASIVLVDATGLTINIAANTELHIRWHLTITVGAAGGVRLQVVVPAGGTSFNNDITLANTVAPATVYANQPSSAAFTNALANAGNHFIDMETHIVNGATAGVVKLQFAQNTSDATAIQLLRGSWMECVGGPF